MEELEEFLDEAEAALEEDSTEDVEEQNEVETTEEEVEAVEAGDVELDERSEEVRSTSREGVTHELRVEERVVGCTCEAYQYNDGPCKHMVAARVANGGDGRQAGDGE